MVTLLNTVEDKFARDICRDHGDRPEDLLEIFQDIQAEAGFISDAAMRTIAFALNRSRAEIHGVVSFYHDFRREPGAKLTLKMCRAEACQASGAEDLVANAETAFGTKLDGKTEHLKLESTYCLGNCALGPAVMIEDQLYGRVDIKRLKSIVAKHGHQS